MKSAGQAVPRQHQLVAAYVTKAANRISAARLVYVDGAAAASDFPLSNSTLFLPGTEVEVLAGSTDAPVSLFKGIVVRQGLKVRDHTAPQLVVECRHQAVKMTVGRKSAYWFDQTDGDVLQALLDAAGLHGTVEATTVTHAQTVQFGSTDWDFLLARAHAAGRLVFTNDDTVAVTKPAPDGAARAQLHFGATLLELDAEIDARGQFQAVKGVTWDPAQQARAEKDAADPGFAGPGNLAGGTLASVVGLDHLTLSHPAVTADEAQAWADAEWLHARLNKAGGRVKCEGIGTVNPGDVVELSGVGQRFSGKVYVTGVRHDFDTVQGWKTHLQFGGVQALPDAGEPVSAPPAAALLPAVSGLQVGVVVGNEDPGGEHRVRVRMPLVSTDADGAWARVAAPDAGKERGFFFRPEVGDEVVLGFLHDDPRQAVILGMLHSSAKTAPLQGSDDNHEKVIETRSRMKVYFNDDTKVMRLETPAGNQVTLSEEDRAVKIVDQNGNRLEMTPDGITIESAKALTLKAGTELKLESVKGFNAKGGTEMKLEGTSGAELGSSAVTKVKGSLVQLN
ncbi:MAG TPA: type VI secretion system tip protein VgrG [Longimicrobium sp.]